VPIPARPTSRWILLGVVLGLCAVTLNPASASVSAHTVDKDETFITAQTAGILDIEGGECFTDPTYLPSAGENVVLYRPCEQHADNQGYGFVHAEDGPFDHTGLTAFGWERCERGFAALFAGRESTLDYYPILPTEETWADGDRDILCVVYDPRGQLTGSVLPVR
jgi:hypothetical protein